MELSDSNSVNWGVKYECFEAVFANIALSLLKMDGGGAGVAEWVSSSGQQVILVL
jgi:hypothetical protein